MSKVGYVFSGTTSGQLIDVLTWHDQGELRVWVHSKASSGGRETVAIEVQRIDNNSPKPSKEEVTLRLKLCIRRLLPKEVNGFKATMFRTLPTGLVLDEHAEVVSQLLSEITGAKNQKISLVEEVISKTVDLRKVVVWDTSEEIKREGGKSKDAILIAKVYAMLQASGTRKLSSRTAELLNMDVSLVHTAVQVARRNGWLTSNGPGIAGGTLTESGLKMFKSSYGEEKLKIIMDSRGGK